MTFRYSARCGMHACFRGMGLGVECACFLFGDQLWNASMFSRYGVGMEGARVVSCGMGAEFSRYGFR